MAELRDGCKASAGGCVAVALAWWLVLSATWIGCPIQADSVERLCRLHDGG